MGGSDSGGGDSYGGSSYDDAPMLTARKRREEKKVREIEDIRAGGGAFGTRRPWSREQNVRFRF